MKLKPLEDRVIIKAVQEEERTASGIVHGTPGLWREHAAVHSMVGPDSRPVPTLDMPSPSLLDSATSFPPRRMIDFSG